MEPKRGIGLLGIDAQLSGIVAWEQVESLQPCEFPLHSVTVLEENIPPYTEAKNEEVKSKEMIILP
jgi:hypothetical protein